MKELTKVSSNERVDIGDFNHVAINSASDQVNELIHNFLVDPSGADRFILSGFEMTNPSGNQVRVNGGIAILHQRLNGEIVESVLSTSGDTYKIVDMSAYPSNTYNIYVRFEHIAGEEQGRIFWNPSGTGSEYTQTVATRYLPNWSVRIETSSPGQEWYRIGRVVMPSMSITDLRDFYFEGSVDSTYQSGWSSEGGGSVNDRSTDRATYGIVDLHTYVAATKQCLEDLKGRGLRNWYSKGIGGMNIGFDDDPIENCLYVNNTGFGLASSATGVYRSLKFTNETSIQYATSADNLILRYDNSIYLTIDDTAPTIDALTDTIGLTINGSGTNVALKVESETGNSANAIYGIGKGIGFGVYGTGEGGGIGVVGVGTGTSSVGVRGQGGTGGAGVVALGGGNGHGILANGNGTGNGIYCTGGSTGNGITAIGGATDGAGVYGEGTATNSNGVVGLGRGTGYGLYGVGGDSINSAGVYCKSGVGGVPLHIVPNVGSPAGAVTGDIWMFGTFLYIRMPGGTYTFDLTPVP